MRRDFHLEHHGFKFAPLLLLIALIVPLLGSAIPASLATAQPSLGMSGSFPEQPFEIPLGSSISGPSIDVWVFNNGAEEMEINMVTVAPHGVILRIQPGNRFTLAPSSSLQLFIAVEVSEVAAPGFYEDGLSVIAQAVTTEGGEVKILGSVALTASLSVVSDYGTVTANTIGAAGEPVLAEIRLFRVIGDTNYEYAYSAGGSLTAVVSPGSYVVYAYKNGEQLAKSETLTVNAGDEITVTLPVTTVSIQGFGLNPQYDPGTNDLTYAQIVYTIVNLDKEMANAELWLAVTYKGVLLETVTILTIDPLSVGRVGMPFTYVPPAGWEEGTYGFRLELYIGGVLYAETLEQTLKVGGGGIASSLWIIFVILGILGAAGLGFLIFFLLKRRQKGEKPEKAEKKERKKKEEKPARKAAEPVRKPEPYRPPEPIRPVQPVRYQEPTVEPTAEPATLSSVSSLKARMASMGRDQGTGKPAEEEPDTEKKDEPVETGPVASQPAPVPPPPKIEPERPAVKKVEEKGHKPPVSEKPAGHKPGIFSKVTATGKKEPPKPPVAQGPAPVKPEDEIQINWPPKTVEPPKPPGDVQINWPPKPVEPPKASALEEAARQRVEAQQHVVAPEEAAPEEEAATEEPSEPQSPPSRSSFSEAARLRMEARLRASETRKPGAGPGESQTEGDATGGSGEGENRPPSP
jgi:hypothetical protein